MTDVKQPWLIETKTVPVASLKNWDKNPREAIDMLRLVKVLKKRGLNTPLLVDGRDMQTVLGGNMRLQAIRTLGWEQVTVSVVHPKDEKDAIEIALENNETYGVYIRDQLAQLLSEFDINKDIRIVTQQVKVSEYATPDLAPENLGENFTLPNGDKPNLEQITFTLSGEQAEVIKQALDTAKQDKDFSYVETNDNENSNGNAIFFIVQQWAEQKRLQ